MNTLKQIINKVLLEDTAAEEKEAIIKRELERLEKSEVAKKQFDRFMLDIRNKETYQNGVKSKEATERELYRIASNLANEEMRKKHNSKVYGRPETYINNPTVTPKKINPEITAALNRTPITLSQKKILADSVLSFLKTINNIANKNIKELTKDSDFDYEESNNKELDNKTDSMLKNEFDKARDNVINSLPEVSGINQIIAGKAVDKNFDKTNKIKDYEEILARHTVQDSPVRKHIEFNNGNYSDIYSGPVMIYKTINDFTYDKLKKFIDDSVEKLNNTAPENKTITINKINNDLFKLKKPLSNAYRELLYFRGKTNSMNDITSETFKKSDDFQKINELSEKMNKVKEEKKKREEEIRKRVKEDSIKDNMKIYASDLPSPEKILRLEQNVEKYKKILQNEISNIRIEGSDDIYNELKKIYSKYNNGGKNEDDEISKEKLDELKKTLIDEFSNYVIKTDFVDKTVTGSKKDEIAKKIKDVLFKDVDEFNEFEKINDTIEDYGIGSLSQEEKLKYNELKNKFKKLNGEMPEIASKDIMKKINDVLKNNRVNLELSDNMNKANLERSIGRLTNDKEKEEAGHIDYSNNWVKYSKEKEDKTKKAKEYNSMPEASFNSLSKINFGKKDDKGNYIADETHYIKRLPALRFGISSQNNRQVVEVANGNDKKLYKVGRRALMKAKDTTEAKDHKLLTASEKRTLYKEPLINLINYGDSLNKNLKEEFISIDNFIQNFEFK